MNLRKGIFFVLVAAVLALAPSRAQSKMTCLPGENWQPKGYPWPLCMPYMHNDQCLYCEVTVEMP